MATIAEQLTSLANTKTAIKDAIVAKGVAVADTDPFGAYPTKIGQISGGGETTKFGVSIDGLLGDVDSDGKYIGTNKLVDFVGTGIKELARGGAYLFYHRAVRSISFPDLIKIKGGLLAGNSEYMFAYNQWAFAGGTSAPVVDLPNLEIIEGQYAADSMFRTNSCSALNAPKLRVINGTRAAEGLCAYGTTKQANLPSLTTINGSSAVESMFQSCQIESVDLSALTTVSGSGACRKMFQDNPNLARVDFPSLVSVEANCFGTASTNSIFYNCTGLLEIHFRADAQATIEALSTYGVKFGATNATIYFDL